MHVRLQIPLPWKSKAWSPKDDTVRKDWRSWYIHISTDNGHFYLASGVGFRDFK